MSFSLRDPRITTYLDVDGPWRGALNKLSCWKILIASKMNESELRVLKPNLQHIYISKSKLQRDVSI